MNARSWLGATRPYGMLDYLRETATERKLRLLGVACCRRVTSRMPNDRFWSAIDLVEQFVEGKATLDALVAAHTAAQGRDGLGLGPDFPLTQTPLAVYSVLGWCGSLAQHRDERRKQCDLVRDIFGNPFRPVAFSPEWRTDTAVSLARTMYDAREFSAMPILADALQDVGCDNDDILTHCRDGTLTHVRGCWVCDLVLGKS